MHVVAGLAPWEDCADLELGACMLSVKLACPCGPAELATSSGYWSKLPWGVEGRQPVVPRLLGPDQGSDAGLLAMRFLREARTTPERGSLKDQASYSGIGQNYPGRWRAGAIVIPRLLGPAQGSGSGPTSKEAPEGSQDCS